MFASSDIRYDEFGQKIPVKLPPWQSGRKEKDGVINQVKNINVFNVKFRTDPNEKSN